MRKLFRDTLFYLGILMFSFWLADTYTKIFIMHSPLRTLWFSSAGLGVTAIALFTRSSFLITSMFSALTVIEGIWDAGFLSKILFNKTIPGVAEYVFTPNYPKWEFAITMYHLLLVPIIIFALYKIKKIHKLGWLGATIFTSVVGFSTYFLVKEDENINCVKTVDYCQSFFKPLYQFDNPVRIFLGIFFLTILLFIPLNFLLLKAKRLFRIRFWSNYSMKGQ